MPNGFFGRRRNPLDLFGGGGTMPYLSAPGGYPGRGAGVAAPAPRPTALQTLQQYPARPKREPPVPIGWKRRLGGAAAAFAARFGGVPGSGTRVGEQIVGAPRRAQEAEYQRGQEEWEAGHQRAQEAYTLGRQGKFDVRAEEAHERQMEVPVPASPEQAHRYRMLERKPTVPSTRVIGDKTTQFNPDTGQWEPIGDAPVYPPREPQLHASRLQTWLSTAMAQLEKLENDILGSDPEVLAQAERRIVEQYNKFADTLGEPHISALPGRAQGAGPQAGQPLDRLGIGRD